jgi:putative MATE family efflux protein
MEEDSTIAQGGVGLAVGLISTLIWGFAQMRTSLSSIISRHFGQKKLDRIYTLIPQSIILTILIGIIIALLTAVFYNQIANLMYGDISARTFRFSNDYFIIRSFGLPISLLIALFFGIFRGYQNTSWAMVISLIGGSVNIILDMILINGLSGYILAMGVSGAATASVISQIVMLLLCVYFLYKKTPFNLKITHKLNPYFKEMILIFWNMFLRTIVLNIVFIMANRYANKNGEIQLAAYTIAYNIWIFSSFFIDGFSNAGNALAGKYLGANDKKTLKVLGYKLLKINIFISLILSIFYTISYPFIGELFNDDIIVLSYFNATFWLIIISQPFNSIAFTFDGIFKGLGKAVLLRNTLLIGTLFIFIPSLLILDYIGLGLSAIWVSMIAWMIFRGGVLLWKFSKL